MSDPLNPTGPLDTPVSIQFPCIVQGQGFVNTATETLFWYAKVRSLLREVLGILRQHLLASTSRIPV